VTLCGRVKQDLFPFSSLLASVTAIQKCQKTLAARTAEREVGKICQGIRNGRITDFFLFSPQLCVGVCMHVQGTERNQKKKEQKRDTFFCLRLLLNMPFEKPLPPPDVL